MNSRSYYVNMPIYKWWVIEVIPQIIQEKNDFLVDSDLKKSSHGMEKIKMCPSLKHI